MNQFGAIAAGHPLTARAAEEILRAGGNAYDAAIAATLMACVTEPVLCSLGGGGFLMAAPDASSWASQHSRSTKPVLFDFFTQTPGKRLSAGDADFYALTVDFGSTTQEFHIGNGSIAVPGLIKGLFAVHERYARLPMLQLAQQAIDTAREGVQISAYQAYIFSLIAPIYRQYASAREIFESRIKPGEILQTNEVFRNPAMADFLEALCKEGANLFYQGEVAQLIESECALGGCLSQPDLAAYEVILREPLEIIYNNHQILTNPPPSAGGCLIGFALDMLEGNLGDKFGTLEHLTTIKEAMQLTNLARVESTASEQHFPDPESLFSNDLLSRYRKEVLDRVRAYRGTTHISIIDRDHNVAAITVSNGEGCGQILPGTGIMLNNMLGEEDLNPSGFFKWQPNQRMSSMMAPTIVHTADNHLIATGSGGSNRIRSAILQVLINLLDFEMDVESAVAAPRIHYEDEVTYIEGGFSTETLQDMMMRYSQHRTWDDQNMFFGGVHTVLSKDNKFFGAGDLRRGGVFINI